TRRSTSGYPLIAALPRKPFQIQFMQEILHAKIISRSAESVYIAAAHIGLPKRPTNGRERGVPLRKLPHGHFLMRLALNFFKLELIQTLITFSRFAAALLRTSPNGKVSYLF